MTSKIKSRLSIDLDPALHRAVKIAAVESDMTLQEVATEALRDWLQRREDREDLAAIAEVEQEPDIPWEQVQQEISRKLSTASLDGEPRRAT